MKNLKNRVFVCFAALILSLTLFTSCRDVWFNDNRSSEPTYYPNSSSGTTSDDTAENLLSFTLELRNFTDKTYTEEGDLYPHSTIDGELIYSWEIPMYGNTVYESVVKFFSNREDKITFRLLQHKFYMFHDCTLLNGSYYNLETVYVAADGKYANCANYQTVLGEDGIAGTADDLKILTLVYKGWLY